MRGGGKLTGGQGSPHRSFVNDDQWQAWFKENSGCRRNCVRLGEGPWLRAPGVAQQIVVAVRAPALAVQPRPRQAALKNYVFVLWPL